MNKILVRDHKTADLLNRTGALAEGFAATYYGGCLTGSRVDKLIVLAPPESEAEKKEFMEHFLCRVKPGGEVLFS